MLIVQKEGLHTILKQLRSLIDIRAVVGQLLVQPHRLVGALGDLAEATLVVLALSSEHLQFLFQVLQCLFDRLLAAIPLLISCLQRAGQVLTILC